MRWGTLLSREAEGPESEMERADCSCSMTAPSTLRSCASSASALATLDPCRSARLRDVPSLVVSSTFT